MSKILNYLEKQLGTDQAAHVPGVRAIFDYLKATDGAVWSSKWNVFVNTKFKGFPSDERTFQLTPLGEMVLKGLTGRRAYVIVEADGYGGFEHVGNHYYLDLAKAQEECDGLNAQSSIDYFTVHEMDPKQ